MRRRPSRTRASGTTRASTRSASSPPASTRSAARRAAPRRSPSSWSASGCSTDDSAAVTELSASRKLKEIIQSIRVTQAYPGADGKQRIIAAYLNQNYYGNESYGVAAAAQGYFGKALDDLTLAEAAIIAALPQSPSAYDLVRNAEERVPRPGRRAPRTRARRRSSSSPPDAPIVQRRNQVLDQMARGRTPLTGDSSPPPTSRRRRPSRSSSPRSSPAVDGPASSSGRSARSSPTRLCRDAETCPPIERGGLDITTTLDLRLQGIAEKWVKAATIVPHAKDPRAAARALGLRYEPWMENLRDKDLRNGALVAKDYQTGESWPTWGRRIRTRPRAPSSSSHGSTSSPMAGASPGRRSSRSSTRTGIANKSITAASMFMDVVTDFGGGYTPTDADNLERGPVRVRDALRFSLNIPAVKAVVVDRQRRGAAARPRRWASSSGRPDRRGRWRSALGVEEVHPLDLVRAYGVARRTRRGSPSRRPS